MMKIRMEFAKTGCFRFALQSGLMLGMFTHPIFAQLQIQESCPDMIQDHVDWLSEGLVATNGSQALYAAVIGTMSSHQLPNNTTASAPDPVQFSSSRIFNIDRTHNLVFVSVLQASPSFSSNSALTAQVTVTPDGVVTVQKQLSNKPLGVPDQFTATCVGNVLTGYANGTQYTIGLQDMMAPQGGPI
jgi:hypothetical protein